MTSKTLFVSLVAAALCSGCNEEGSKHEWSILQAAEFRHRDEPLTEQMKVEFYEDYCAVGFVPKGARERVWVLMNPKYRPTVKKLPNLPLVLTAKEFESLPAKCRQDARIEKAITGSK